MARSRTRFVSGRTMASIEGLEDVKALLRTLRDEAPQVYDQELKDGALQMKSIALSHIKNDSGALSESGKVKSVATQSKRMESLIFGGIIAPHAHLVEFGHRKITKTGEIGEDVPAHPFLRTAFEQYKDILLQKLMQAIDRLASM